MTCVLQWPGIIGEPLDLMIHEACEIAMVEAGESAGYFNVWTVDHLIREMGVHREMSGWKRTFHVAATGQEVPYGWQWRASWRAGAIVWHLFEEV